MNQADVVREYGKTRIIDPARARGDRTVSIRAGDVHSALGFKNRLPLVCSALGTEIFEEFAQVKRIAIDGPMNGANTVFTFRLTVP